MEDIKEQTKTKFVSETIFVPVELVILENSVRGGHSAKLRETTWMPPEGYEVIFACRGGVLAVVSVA